VQDPGPSSGLLGASQHRGTSSPEHQQGSIVGASADGKKGGIAVVQAEGIAQRPPPIWMSRSALLRTRVSCASMRMARGAGMPRKPHFVQRLGFL